MSRWRHQILALQEIPRLLAAGRRRICLTTPTGGGKTLIICDLIEWAVAQGWKVVLYTNRKLLIDQLIRVLNSHGILFGVRAACHHDDRQRDVQISSLLTENSRVLKRQLWQVHGHGEKVLAIVDEAHLNAGPVAQKILNRHIMDGGAYVGLTATPIDLSHLYEKLFVAGKPSELRACGAIVPAYHYGVDEPDMQGFKQNVKTGEYRDGDVTKAVMTKCILGRVLDNYQKLNPDQRPTLLFAPGVRESIWFAEQLTKSGICAAHIDGEGIWIGGEYKRTQDRGWLLDEMRAGAVKVLCNRFVLREGLDLKEVSHVILATVMGSLRTYLQSVGRGMRVAEGKDRLTIQDHGGHWWRHGSVNVDRQWNLSGTENRIADMRADTIREKKEAEPFRCVQCGMVRLSGLTCPACGFESTKRTRMVIQENGVLKEHEGDIFKPRVVRQKKDTAQLWTQYYYRARNSRNHMTFRQAEGLFFLEQDYYPPRTLPLMPTDPADWFLPVRDVPKERLTQAEQPAAP
jgi:DNA repair protein RadD